ncbi:MAG: response regulator, partial [Actinobacteria bacterium]|nr:response regulator [Actinomycetota bacterium]NIS35796.1 response regulator [Actinomycetota bacterium]NIU70426.1 response regulator [Actinomycetota bacterium]NIV58517.1 response regulator [Actinomycetota bacterium]NIV90077.1 response regulator [Actinomycetota bacterium]
APDASGVQGPEADDRFVVAVVDDEDVIATYLARVVEELGTAKAHVYTSPREFVEAWSERVPDLLITDFQMPDLNGVELIQE